MSWVRLEGKFFRHAKIAGLPAGPRFLYIAALCYCGDNETDGFVPLTVLPLLAVDACQRQWRDIPATLCAVGLWTACEGGYRVHDYLDYNPSREQLRAGRDRTAARVSAWRERQRNGVTEPQNPPPEPSRNGVTEALVTPLVTPLVTLLTERNGTLRDDQAPSSPQAAVSDTENVTPLRAKRARAKPPAPPPLSEAWRQVLESCCGPQPKRETDQLARIEHGGEPPPLAAVRWALRRAGQKGIRRPVSYAMSFVDEYPGEGHDEQRQRLSGNGRDAHGAGHRAGVRGEIRPGGDGARADGSDSIAAGWRAAARGE